MSYARICVKVDISQPIPDKYKLRVGGKDVTLPVKWDKIPLFCKDCKHVGHSEDRCYAFGKLPNPPKKDFSRPPQRQPEMDTRQREQPREAHGSGIGATGWTIQGDRHQGQGSQSRGVGQWVQFQRKGAQTGRSQGDPRQQSTVSGETENQLTGDRNTGEKQAKVGTMEEERRQKLAQIVPARFIPQATAQETARGRRDYIPSWGLKVWDPVIELTTPAIEKPSTLGKKKKKRSEASRERYREQRRQQMEGKVDGYCTSGSGNSEFETDDSEDEQRRTRSTTPTQRGRTGLRESMRDEITVHSNRFEILEDEPTADELAMVVHEGNVDTSIIQAARTRPSTTTSSSNRDSQPLDEGRFKKTRVSTSQHS